MWLTPVSRGSAKADPAEGGTFRLCRPNPTPPSWQGGSHTLCVRHEPGCEPGISLQTIICRPLQTIVRVVRRVVSGKFHALYFLTDLSQSWGEETHVYSGFPEPGGSWGLGGGQPLTAQARLPQGSPVYSLGCVCLVYAVTQLEFVGLAPVQGRETRDQVDQLPGGRRRGPRGLQLVLLPHGRRAWRRHGGDDIGGARWGADGMPLPGRRGQGAVARLQGWRRAQARVGVHGEPVDVGVHRGPGGGAGVTVVLGALGLDPGALGEVGADPRGGLRRAHGVVLLPRLRGGPLDGPVLFGEVAA